MTLVISTLPQMTFEPLVLMPDPGALSAPHVYRAHSLSGAAVASMFHTNVRLL